MAGKAGKLQPLIHFTNTALVRCTPGCKSIA
jgi:hypothetical protein